MLTLIIIYLGASILNSFIAISHRFTSGHADCCNINRMKRNRIKNTKPKKWNCVFRNSNEEIKETCGKTLHVEELAVRVCRCQARA